MPKNPETKVTFKVFNEDFNKKIGEMKSQSSKLRQEFTLQEAQLGNNASETDKLRVKLDYLGKAHQLAGQKVADTQAQLNRVKQQFGENSTEAGKMERSLLTAKIAEQKLANEISQTNTSLKNQTETIKKTNKSLDEVGQKAKDVGGKMTATVTPAVAGMGLAVGKVAMDFDNATGQIQAQLGLTADEAEELTDAAKSVWKKGFGENIGEVSDGLAIVKQNIQGISNEALPDVTEKAFIFQKVFKADIPESTRTASVMMKNFGIDATTAFDLMTYGMQNGGNFSDELLDTLREYSPQFKAMGYNAEEMTAILIAGAKEGAFNLDKIGDAAKESFLRIGDGSKSSREALQGLGLDYKKIETDISSGGQSAKSAFAMVASSIAAVKDPAERAQASIALFGTPLEDLGPQFQNFFAKVDTDLGNFKGATEKAGKAVEDTFGMKLSKMFRTLQDSLKPMGDALLNVAETIMPKVNSALGTMSKWFTGLSTPIQQTIIVFGGLMAILGPLLSILGFMVSGIGKLIGPIMKLLPLLSKLGPMFKIIRTAMLALTGPVGIISAIVVALAIVIYKNWDTIKEKTIEIWGIIKTWLSDTWESIKTTLSNVWNNIKTTAITLWTDTKDFFINLWTSTKETMATIWESIKQVFTNAWNAIVSGVTAIITPFVNGITNIFNSMKSGISTIFEGVKEIFSNAWTIIKNIVLGAALLILNLVTGNFTELKKNFSQIMNNIKTAATNIWNGIKKVFTGTVSAIKGAVTTGWNQLKTNTQNVFNAVKTFLTNTWNNIKTFVQNTATNIKNGVVSRFNALRDSISNAMNSAKTKISSIWNSIKTTSTNLPETIKNTVRNKFQDMKDAVGQKMIEAKEKVVNGWNEAKKFLSNIDLKSIGKDIIDGLINGIRNKISDLASAVSEAGSTITNKLKSVLNIHSPSRVMYEIGQFVGQGLENGIAGTQSQVAKTTESLAKKIKDTIQSGLETKTSDNKKLITATTTLKQQQRSLDDIVRKRKATAAKIASLNKQMTKTKSKKTKSSLAKQLKSENSKLLTLAKQQKTAQDRVNSTKRNISYLQSDKKAAEKLIGLKSLERYISDQSKKLNAIAKQRDDVNTKLKDANKKLADLIAESNKYANEIADKARSYASMSTIDVSGGIDANKIKNELAKRLQTIKTFAANIEELRKKGVNSTIIEDLLSAGVDNGSAYAEALAVADKQTIDQINSIQASINGASDHLGQKAADAMYSAGINAAKGLVKGLESQQKELTNAANKIADAIESAIKKKLKIHSPSRLMRDEVGKFIPLGLIQGIESLKSKVIQSAGRMAEWATPAVNSGGANNLVSKNQQLSDSMVQNIANNNARVVIHATVRNDRDMDRLVDTVDRGMNFKGVRRKAAWGGANG